MQDQIVFEDNHLLVINKKAGQLVQGDKTGEPAQAGPVDPTGPLIRVAGQRQLRGEALQSLARTRQAWAAAA